MILVYGENRIIDHDKTISLLTLQSCDQRCKADTPEVSGTHVINGLDGLCVCEP